MGKSNKNNEKTKKENELNDGKRATTISQNFMPQKQKKLPTNWQKETVNFIILNKFNFRI